MKIIRVPQQSKRRGKWSKGEIEAFRMWVQEMRKTLRNTPPEDWEIVLRQYQNKLAPKVDKKLKRRR